MTLGPLAIQGLQAADYSNGNCNVSFALSGTSCTYMMVWKHRPTQLEVSDHLHAITLQCCKSCKVTKTAQHWATLPQGPGPLGWGFGCQPDNLHVVKCKEDKTNGRIF
jgi:hypothetical protein